MAYYHQGIFQPTHPEKVINTGPIRVMSGWELKVDMFLDTNPNIIKWGSEIIKIPYFNPIKKKQSIYIPDYFVQVLPSSGIIKNIVYEVKPASQTFVSKAKSFSNKCALLVNRFKWAAAVEFCKKHGIEFKILTEDQIFSTFRK